MVRDEACVGCHSTTPQHTDPEFYDLEAFTETRCATCHKDHNGLDGIIRNDDTLCADCHHGLAEHALETDLRDASDFGDDHPEFRPTLTRHLEEEGKTVRAELNPDNWPVEQSGLKFSHKAHLVEEGLRTPEGRVILECASCHVAEPGGGYMKPVNMDQMCARCHELNFDEVDPDRYVPHGDMQYVMYTIQDYYGNRALQGGYDDPEVPEVVRRRRRPGERLTESERQVALAWAQQKAREVAEDMIELRTCYVCHFAGQVQEEPPMWEIKPVRVAEVWMPKSSFSHSKHATEACERCHEQAPTSEDAEDVLLPRIELCRECHGGAHDKERLASTCIDCHSFHIYEDVLMSDRVLKASTEGSVAN